MDKNYKDEEKGKPDWPESERQLKCCAELERKLEIENALNSIFQLRQHTVYSTQLAHQDIYNLQLLNIRLQQTGAEEEGLCEKRSTLYSQGLDEVIRIVTINLNERGVLLSRIRGDLNITLRSWVTIISPFHMVFNSLRQPLRIG